LAKISPEIVTRRATAAFDRMPDNNLKSLRPSTVHTGDSADHLRLAKGRLRRVLEEWCLPYSGYHLFYPSRRQSSAAFALIVDALRHRRAA
jgi:DNA-binding transcriptional LysR family regulator